MKTLRIYQITKQQAENTEYRPLDVEIEEIETEDGWNYADVIENDGDGYQAEKITETRDGLIVWRVFKEYEYTDGTTETEAEFFYVEIADAENDDRELQFVDTRKNAILGIGDDCGFDEYDLVENGVANTYQVTANELIEMLEAAQNGFTLESLQSDDNIMSVELSNGKTKLEYNFVR